MICRVLASQRFPPATLSVDTTLPKPSNRLPERPPRSGMERNTPERNGT